MYRPNRTVPSACFDQLCFYHFDGNNHLICRWLWLPRDPSHPGLCWFHPQGSHPLPQEWLWLPLSARGTLSSTKCQGKSVKNAQNFCIKFLAFFFFFQSDIILDTFTLNRMKWACSDQLSTTGWTLIFYFSSSDVFQSFLFSFRGPSRLLVRSVSLLPNWFVALVTFDVDCIWARTPPAPISLFPQILSGKLP